jgi:flagellar motor switch protein FliG
VGLTGKQKAAMLLMSLDPATAGELMKGIDQQVVQELAVEVAYLDAAGYRSSTQSMELAREFYKSLTAKEEGFELNNFLKEMLRSTVGSEKAEQIQTGLQELLWKRDPFISIRSVDSRTIASVLEGEHPQAAAVVLSELPAKKGSEVLGLLGEGVRISAIRRMTGYESVTIEAKVRVAEMVRRRIEGIKIAGAATTAQSQPEQSLRKVAVILRSLGKELRDGLLGAIQGKDAKAGETITNLMIVWEDIPQVADRSLQGALRGIDARKLALAFYKADEIIVKKIRSNISERLSATVDEETSLMSAPKKKDIEEAKEEIVRILRGMNEKGELAFVEE